MDTDNRKLLSVAIDFGTTYSGYAYSTLDDFENNPTQIYANTDWPCTLGKANLSSKTPTSLLLDKNKKFKAFGYEADQQYLSLAEKKKHYEYYYFKRFKMTLHEKGLNEDSMIEDIMFKPVRALLVFSESIRYLKDQFLRKLDNTGLPIDKSEICWVLTVPAIWNDSAKRFMRTAAVEAGILPNQLKIGLEPECASIFCQHLKLCRDGKTICKPGPGTKSMVVDLGGGTADITVHEKLQNGKLMELYKASGVGRGGTAIDDEYVRFLTRIVGGPAMQKFRMEATAQYVEMLNDFEVTKRSIRSHEDSSVYVRLHPKLNEFCIEVNEEEVLEIIKDGNFPYKDKIGLVADKLEIDVQILKNLFDPVVEEIVEHIRDILSKDVAAGVSIILMVGGFSESTIVQDKIKEHFASENCRVIIPPETSLTVVKGATLFGHYPSVIASRITRYTYGVRTDEIFDGSKHSIEHLEKRHDKNYCTNIFDTFMEMDTSVEVGKRIEQKYHFDEFDGDCYLDVYVSNVRNPQYVTDKNCRLLKELNLGQMLPAAIGRRCNIVVEYIFGDTEVYIMVREKDSNFQFTSSFELKREETFTKEGNNKL